VLYRGFIEDCADGNGQIFDTTVRVDCFSIIEKGKNTALHYGANNSTIAKGVQPAGSVRESKGVLILLQLERGKWKYIYSRKKCNNPLSHPSETGYPLHGGSL